mgnify:CR=1 FL=1|jgi:hypothetical protein
MTKNHSIWNYSVLANFNRNVFGDLLTVNHLESDYEEMVKILEDGEKIEHHGYYFKDKEKKLLYFIDSEINNESILDKLPFAILDSDKCSYSRKVFHHVTDIESFKIIPEKRIEFRTIIDKMLDIKHGRPDDLKLWSIIVLASWLDKIMVRVSSPAGFGKDSIANIFGNLLNGIVVAKPRTVAKFEYLLNYSEGIFINEMSSSNKEQKNLVEDFILQTADFSLSYEKGSRAMVSGTKEKSGLDNLSLIFLYNDLDHYDNPDVFFDNLFNNKAVYDRLLPLKFDGRVDVSQFHNNFDITTVAKQNQQFFLDTLKSLHWYKQNYRKELRMWALGKSYPLTERHKKSFMKITEFINIYSKTKEEFRALCDKLYQCYVRYNIMAKGGSATLDVFQDMTPDTLETPDFTEEKIEFDVEPNMTCECNKCNCHNSVESMGMTCEDCILGDHK